MQPQLLDAPVWLAQESEISALLHAALDRFDRQPALARQRDVFLSAERYLPSLTRADMSADQTWGLMVELQARGLLTIRRARRGPYDPDWTGAKLVFSPSIEPVLRHWLGRDRAMAELERWRVAVRRHAQAFPGGCEALLARRVAIEGRTAEEVADAFARITTLRGPITLRQLSAWAFWGDSKVLDDRAELIAALFPNLLIRERAIVVSVFLPQACEAVLFIENQDTYTGACAGHLTVPAGCALVFASGFRSSAQRVRTREGAILHYAGSEVPRGRQRFEAWWFEQGEPLGPCWFWGDLDFAGMQILKSLRSRFGAVSAWQPGYEPMVRVLRARGEDRPGGAPRGQTDPGSTGCSYADAVLLPAIRDCGPLDQEHAMSREDASGAWT